LDRAFGCGCPDGGGGRCDAKYSGFEAQAECAASLTADYMKSLEGGGSTVSGWKVGAPKATEDGYTVTPVNRATAALYTYTPWVGDKAAAGYQAPFGNKLFWDNWSGYAKKLGYSGATASQAAAVGCKDDASCNTGGKSGRVCSNSGPRKGQCIYGCHDDSVCKSGTTCDKTLPTWSCTALPLGAACAADTQCDGGRTGTGAICGASSLVCIAGCHADADCKSGESCDKTAPSWKCKAQAAPPAVTPSGKPGDLNVPYECQNTNKTGNPGGTCQITSAAMVVRYWGLKGAGSGKSAMALDLYDKYLGEVGSPFDFWKVFGSPAGVARIFTDYGLQAKAITNGTRAQMKAHLDAGRPLVVNGYFTGGHVVVFVGYDSTGWWLNDPNGQWQGLPNQRGEVSYGPNYSHECPDVSGQSVHLSSNLIDSTDVIGADGDIWFAVADSKPF
jgi:hypothetical protein